MTRRTSRTPWEALGVKAPQGLILGSTIMADQIWAAFRKKVNKLKVTDTRYAYYLKHRDDALRMIGES